MRRKRELIVDTNVVLRFLLGDVPELYKKACEVFKEADSGLLLLLLTDITISECVWVLEKFYKTEREEVGRKLTALILHDAVNTETQKTALKEALDLWSSSPLDWADALLVAKARVSNRKIATFDKEVVKKFPALCVEFER